MNTIKFNDANGLTFVGDVHGQWSTLAHKASVQYQLENYVIIQLGDFGIGFHSEEHNKVELKKLNSKLKKKKNHLVVVRGNHDDPKYFDGVYSKSYSNIHLVSDYTVIEIFYTRELPQDDNSLYFAPPIFTISKNILCIGGGLSVDRTERWRWEREKPGRKYYWEGEMPIYNESKIDEINKKFPNNIDIIASHTAPSFVYPYTKSGIQSWIMVDMQLKYDVDTERKTMDNNFYKIKDNQKILSKWYYGHFHATQTTRVNNIDFCLLDICEFREERLN